MPAYPGRHLSPATLHHLEDIGRNNGEGLAWMQQRMQRNDHASARLSPGERAEYGRMRTFFRMLPFHEGNARTYSWVTRDEQVYFFPPTILSHPCRVVMEMRVCYRRGRPGVVHGLLETGLHQGWHTETGSSFQIRGTSELVRALQLIHRLHDGYILPGSERWLQHQQAQAAEPALDFTLATIRQPDCWI